MKPLIAVVTLCLTLGPVWAREIDAAKLKSYLSSPYSVATGFMITGRQFTSERVVGNPKAEMMRLETRLTGEASDAPLHLRLGELYGMRRSDPWDRYFSEKALEQYELAAEQYKSLVAEAPSDPVLLLGYAKALGRSGGEEQAGDILRKLIAADPAAWEARLELANVLESQAMSGIDAERLFGEAAEQRDQAIRRAPDRSEPYVARFMSQPARRFMNLFPQMLQPGELQKMDKKAITELAAKAIDPLDLRRALQYDPGNATIVRGLVFFEILKVVLEEASTQDIDKLLKGIFADDPAERTWNLISEENRAKLSKYEPAIQTAMDKQAKDRWAAYEALGLLKLFQGKRGEAEAAFTTASGLSPAADLAYMFLFAEQLKGEPAGPPNPQTAAKMIPLWEQRVKLTESPSEMLNLASLYAMANRLDEAESTVRLALREDSENLYGHYVLGVLMLKRGADAREAAEHLEKALALHAEALKSPKLGPRMMDESWTEPMQIDLAVAYAIAGDAEKAVEVLGKISDESDWHGTAWEVVRELGPPYAGHVIYVSGDYIFKYPDGTMGKPSGERVTEFAPAPGSVIVARPDGVATVFSPDTRVDPPDAPASDYYPGRIVIKLPDGETYTVPEGSTIEVLPEAGTPSA